MQGLKAIGDWIKYKYFDIRLVKGPIWYGYAVTVSYSYTTKIFA